jgi:hypothetical protein
VQRGGADAAAAALAASRARWAARNPLDAAAEAVLGPDGLDELLQAREEGRAAMWRAVRDAGDDSVPEWYTHPLQ